MKYLIFNCAVFLALVYLIIGGDLDDLADEIQNNAEKKTETVSMPLSEKPRVELPVQDEVVPIAAVEPKIEVVKAAPVQAPALPKAVEIAKTKVKKIPSRKNEAAPVQTVEQDNSAPVPFIENKKDRRNELRQMVADMEQMFAEKLIR